MTLKSCLFATFRAPWNHLFSLLSESFEVISFRYFQSALIISSLLSESVEVISFRYFQRALKSFLRFFQWVWNHVVSLLSERFEVIKRTFYGWRLKIIEFENVLKDEEGNFVMDENGVPVRKGNIFEKFMQILMQRKPWSLLLIFVLSPWVLERHVRARRRFCNVFNVLSMDKRPLFH